MRRIAPAAKVSPTSSLPTFPPPASRTRWQNAIELEHSSQELYKVEEIQPITEEVEDIPYKNCVNTKNRHVIVNSSAEKNKECPVCVLRGNSVVFTKSDCIGEGNC